MHLGRRLKAIEQRFYDPRVREGTMEMRSEYYDCEPVPEGLAQYANELDYTTADLQIDPDLRKRLEAEYEAQQHRFSIRRLLEWRYKHS